MFCSQCGSEISPSDALCHSCGRPQPVKAAAPVAAERLRHPYYGVGGWLILFLIGLFLSPFLYVRNVLLRFQHNMDVFAHATHPYSLYAFYGMETLAGFAVYGYGLFAGIQLLRIRPRAVDHAKRFLIYLLCYRIADYARGLNWIALMGSEHSRATAFSNFLVGQSAQTLLRSAIYIAVWYAYLTRSERVRVTYS